MAADLVLSLDLLVLLAGTFLYGFVTRELVRELKLRRRNLPLLFLAACLALWYAGGLTDEILAILGGWRWSAGPAGTLLDLGRGFAWLFSFPLLAHALWRMLPGATRPPPGWRRPSPLWLVPSYATLLFFLPTARTAWEQRAVGLAALGREVLPWFLLHAVLGAAVAAAFIRSALGTTDDPTLRRFLRWLLAERVVTVSASIASALLLRFGGGRGWVEPAWILATLASGLVLGATFLYFVRSYNLLRLSLSYRSLRHFLAVALLVALVMAAGPTVGAEGSALYRRLVAWGLVAALVAGSLGSPLLDRAARRSPGLRRLLGRAAPPEELERLSQRLQSLAFSDGEARAAVAAEIERWLGVRVRFLAVPGAGTGAGAGHGPDSDPDEALLWRHFAAGPGARGFTRLDVPGPGLAQALGRRELHAVFPLRVGAELDSVLALGVSPTGGGYGDGEVDAVRLVLGQLGLALEVRRLLEARVRAEREAGERERLGMLGLVAASLAHEVRNPLAAMKALAQTVGEELERSEPGSPRARDLAVIIEQIDRLHAVTREVLGFARPRDEEGLDLAALVRSALYILDPEGKRRGLAIDGSGIEEVAPAPGTAAGWQTVVFNLVLNALHHAPAGTTVEVGLRCDPSGVVFEARNRGPAMGAEIAARLFEPWVSDGGTGLGLALVARRVREWQGSIEVINEPDRIVFRVRVPVPAPSPAATARMAAAAPEMAGR